jgi:transposase-like protein
MKESEALSRRQKWVELIRQQEGSGVAVSAFCREHSVSEPSFYGWRKRLKASGPVRFALVDASAPSAINSAAIELVLVSGDRLRILPGTDTATLRSVLSVLRERT